jgi:hypothetical protein
MRNRAREVAGMSAPGVSGCLDLKEQGRPTLIDVRCPDLYVLTAEHPTAST